MISRQIEIDGIRCRVFVASEDWVTGQTEAEYLLVQPCDDHELEQLDREAELIGRAGKPFVLIAFKVSDWNVELSPWEAPPVFGNTGFGSGAGQTLHMILEKLLAYAKTEFPGYRKVILGGYSLAGLFSLWSAYQTDAFDAIAAVSPSVWFDKWIPYIEERKVRSNCVYLSLGDKEHQTKNERMRTVRDCIIRQQERFQEQGIVSVLEWNSGNHFRNPEIRTADGFAWAIERLWQPGRMLE